MTREEIAVRILEAGIRSGDTDATPDMMVQVAVRMADMLKAELERTAIDKLASMSDVQ